MADGGSQQARLLAAFRAARVSSVVIALADCGFFSALDGKRTVEEIGRDLEGVKPERLVELVTFLIDAGLLDSRCTSDLSGDRLVAFEERILSGPDHPGTLTRYLAGEPTSPWTPQFRSDYLRGTRFEPRAHELLGRFHGLAQGELSGAVVVVVSTTPETWFAKDGLLTGRRGVAVPVEPGTGYFEEQIVRDTFEGADASVDLVLHNVIHYRTINDLLEIVGHHHCRTLLVVDVFVGENGDNSEFALDWLTHGGPCIHRHSDLIELMLGLDWSLHRTAQLGFITHSSFVRTIGAT